MKIQAIKIGETAKWDYIVKSFNNYDIYYLNGYVRAFQLHGDGEPTLFYYENGNTRAMNVVLKRDIARNEYFIGMIEENKYFDLSTPYGYGGFLLDGDDIAGLNEEYTNYCLDHNIVSEFVRFHPLLENWKGMNLFYEITHLGQTVCMDTTSQNVIWSNITSKNRNMIRKANKSGLKTYWSRDEKLIDTFIEIYNTTMDRDAADPYYYFNKDFYTSILNDMKYNAMWFYTVLERNIVAMAIFMFSNGNMHYHLSASRKEYQTLAPTNLLIFEAASWACENGFSKMHLGGGLGSKCDNLYKFKKAFHKGDDTEFYIGKKIFHDELYKKLVDIRKLEGNYNLQTSFFPAYRG